MNKAIFHLKLLSNYQVINGPGVHLVSIAYTVTNKNLILDDHPRYLIPLRVITPAGLESIIQLLKTETEKVPFELVRDKFMTGAVWFGDVIEEDLPVKGERVLATFDLKDGKLLCTNIELLPREELDYVNINNLILFRKTLINLLSKELN